MTTSRTPACQNSKPSDTDSSPSLPPLDSLLLSSPHMSLGIPPLQYPPSTQWLPRSLDEISLQVDHTYYQSLDGKIVPFPGNQTLPPIARFTPTHSLSTHRVSPYPLASPRLNPSANQGINPPVMAEGDPDKRYVCPFYGQPKNSKRMSSTSSTLPSSHNMADDVVCTARFRRKQEMERHVLSVHGAHEEKAWVCPGTTGGDEGGSGVGVCGKRYARADALRKHLDSAKSKMKGGCSFGLSEEEISAIVRSARQK